ncbi:regulatory protein RecX [Aridibaculum aurantiacum]|uniref:regulatory protein RecX n=1 Tax=Aridibaculum aurantiacum TaxID=2810307 RepID=UPI001A962F5E|nr:regulatory protein RecX [Aridibaculum aurantiacum]
MAEEQILKKIKHYCAYQERCHSEVKEKLYSLGLYKNQVEEIIANLIADNYLNEERFAIQYAGGKFRIKHWGKRKISYELKQKGVSSYCIKIGLKSIDEEEYENTLAKLALAKWDSLRGQQYLVKLNKTKTYLVQKGFEPDMVHMHLQTFKKV